MSPSGNSSVYLLTDSESQRYVAKLYPPPERTRADRLQVEFTSLTFLKKNGILCIPAPLASLPEKRQALYSFLPGRPPVEITTDDVEEMARFFLQLQTLRDAPQASSLPIASEACFGLEQHFDLLLTRVAGLNDGLLPEDVEVADFLRKELLPFIMKLQGSCDRAMLLCDLVLSPSDFGFHNCLRDPDGGLNFLDFEYFGWDDLTKTVADFLLHPQHRDLQCVKGRFLEVMKEEALVSAGFMHRLGQVYLLCGAKWCIIMLNVFLRHRRKFTLQFSGFQRQRLDSARELLSDLKRGPSL